MAQKKHRSAAKPGARKSATRTAGSGKAKARARSKKKTPAVKAQAAKRRVQISMQAGAVNTGGAVFRRQPGDDPAVYEGIGVRRTSPSIEMELGPGWHYYAFDAGAGQGAFTLVATNLDSEEQIGTEAYDGSQLLGLTFDFRV